MIDAASQYLWVQLIEHKDPLVAYVDHFLKKHGLHKMDSAVIMTSPDGYQAKSKAFARTLNNHKFDIVEQEFHADFDVNLDNVECII